MNIVATLQKNKIWPFHKLEEANVDVSKDIILYIEGLTVSFDGVKALNDLSM